MNEPMDEDRLVQSRRDQMLKLVSRGFYNELVNYGVAKEEILRVASHLLDNLITSQPSEKNRGHYYDKLFSLEDVRNEWDAHRRITVREVSLGPLEKEQVPTIAGWLSAPQVRDHFIPAYPEPPAALTEYFNTPDRMYFSIHHRGRLVGMIGGENLDFQNRKLEMKKLVGAPDTRGLGIGKLATFAFLHHVFVSLEMHKVFVHSRDINMRNINLNSRFGFEVEGIFLEDINVENHYRDVVRMALFRTPWLEIFSNQ